MNKNALYALLIAAALIPAGTAEARSHVSAGARAELRSDRSELSSDRRALADDRRDIVAARRAGDRAGVIENRRELSNDRREIMNDRREYNQDLRSSRYDRHNSWTGDRYRESNRYNWYHRDNPSAYYFGRGYINQ